MTPGSDARLARRLALGTAVGLLAAVPLTLLALLVRGRWGPLRRLDLGVAGSVHGYVLDTPPLRSALQGLAVALHPWVFRVAVLVLVAALLRRGAPRLALWAAVTMTLGSITSVVLKLVVARARPVFEEPITLASGPSFPSGHAVNAAVATLVLLLAVIPALPSRRARAAARVAGALVVLAAGAHRVGLGVHYVSDVVAGWAAGAGVVAATAMAFEGWCRGEGRAAHDPLDGVDPEESQRLAP